MSYKNLSLGRKGEDIASRYLINQGYSIICRNIYIGGGEIDIVAKIQNVIVFVEVKTRSNEVFSDIIDTFNEKKEEALLSSCEEYIRTYKLEDVDYRIDLVGIVLYGKKIVKLEHIEDFI
jgi:putative endonuclease